MRDFLEIDDNELLLKKFNNRDGVAFSQVYFLLYNDLYYFTSYIYRETEVVASDVIHDIFIKIWEAESRKFATINNIKAYLFVAIKNSLRNYIDHQKTIHKYAVRQRLTVDNFVSEVVETETLSIISQAINLLPEDCADIFKLHLEGWEVKDIAKKLHKSESTIYAKKQQAISLLKSKLPKELLSAAFFLPFLS